MELYQCELYIRYLYIAHAFKSKNKESTKASASSRTKKGQLRELITNKITSHFEQPFIEFKQNGLFYAYVESANITPKTYVFQWVSNLLER